MIEQNNERRILPTLLEIEMRGYSISRLDILKKNNIKVVTGGDATLPPVGNGFYFPANPFKI